MRIINKVLKELFGSMSLGLYSTLLSLLFNAAEEKDYLENLTSHADSIHKYLSSIDITKFEDILCEFFQEEIKQLRKKVSWTNIFVAFDETYIAYYGNVDNNWICEYTNKIKGATGSYKFMVCSIILRNKRYILGAFPMHASQDALSTINKILELVKTKFIISAVLCDRGFCSKKICRSFENQNLKYLILCPKWKNIKKYMDAKELEVIEFVKINEKKTITFFEMRFVFAYKFFGHDWAFATNIRMNVLAMILTYKGRWGIETNFRVMDLAEIKSKSKNIVARMFFFWISIILFNMWLDTNKSVTFEKYLDMIALAGKSKEQILEEWNEAKLFFDKNKVDKKSIDFLMP